MVEMEKYCPKCGRVYKNKESEAKVCMYCAIPLKERKGRIPLSKGIRDKVLQRDGYRCVKCGASQTDRRLEIDHIIPVARGGTNDIDNLRTLCWVCNQDEGAIVPNLGLKYDIEDKENQLKILNKHLQETEKKLNNATTENEKIEYSFNITRFKEDIFSITKELDELKIKYQEEQNKIRIKKEKQEKHELLFKKLYVDLSPMEKLVLKEKFNLNNLSDEDLLKTLCAQYSEKEIMATIENYKTDLNQFLNNSIKFNMLPFISSELSLNNDSKQFIINHLYKNYTKTQIIELFESINNELFNEYDLSFNNIEKSLLKRHYSLTDASDSELINYVIQNDFSIDELKNTIELTYKNVFQEFYNQLNDKQKHIVKFRFKNSKKNLVDFLATKHFSSEELNDELNKVKIELFNKTYDSLSSSEKSLIERYSKVYSNFDLVNYFYENKFSDEKINELIEISKKPLITEVHNNLNDHQMFLLKNTFKNDDSLINFMIDHKYSFKSLRKKLKETEKIMESDLNNSLNNKQKFLLKKYFSISNNPDLITYLINNEHNLDESLKIAEKYEKKLYDDFNYHINYDYEQILYNKFSLNVNSKNDLINYLIYEGYSVKSMKSLIKNDVFKKYSNVLDINSISLLCYKFKLVTATKISPITLKDYLFDKDYAVYDIQQSIKEAKIELTNELDYKLDHRAVGLLNKKIELNKSKNDFISYLIDNYSVEFIRDLLKKYHINI